MSDPTTDPNVTVTDVTKEVTCGDVRVTIHIGAFGFIRISPHELPIGEIPNLIAALHTAHDIATQCSPHQEVS